MHRGPTSAIRGFKESLSAPEPREGRPSIRSSSEHDHAPGA
jgi:hypothetical protein